MWGGYINGLLVVRRMGASNSHFVCSTWYIYDIYNYIIIYIYIHTFIPKQMIQASIARFCYIAPYMEVMGVTSFLSVDRAKMPSGNKNYPLAAVGTPRKIQGMQSPEGYC
jgi:hypothetical protein